MPYIPDELIDIGQRYIYAPPNGLYPRLVQVVGVAQRPGHHTSFMYRFVKEDGTLGTSQTSLGFFKHDISKWRSLKQKREPRKISATGREKFELELEVQEA